MDDFQRSAREACVTEERKQQQDPQENFVPLPNCQGTLFDKDSRDWSIQRGEGRWEVVAKLAGWRGEVIYYVVPLIFRQPLRHRSMRLTSMLVPVAGIYSFSPMLRLSPKWMPNPSQLSRWARCLNRSRHWSFPKAHSKKLSWWNGQRDDSSSDGHERSMSALGQAIDNKGRLTMSSSGRRNAVGRGMHLFGIGPAPSAEMQPRRRSTQLLGVRQIR